MIMGVTLSGEVQREAPAQAELRPTFARAFIVLVLVLVLVIDLQSWPARPWANIVRRGSLALTGLFCPFGSGVIAFDQGNQVMGGRLHVRNIFLRDGGSVRQLLADLL